PRNDALLARQLHRAFDLKMYTDLTRFLPGARWARGKEVDPVLAQLAFHANDDLRHAAVEAIGWRLPKRKRPPHSLVKLPKPRAPETPLLAAEGLARAGKPDGLSVLLAAVDLQENLEMRQRAVSALGELGDARALDLLLKIANDPEHVLRDEAAEAL